jgi:hypothetical protein
MRRIYPAAGWAIILFGLFHGLAATKIFEELSERALWFVSGGLAMMLVGALNLLNHRYGAMAPGVQRVCVAANVVMTIFAITAGIVSRANLGQLVVVGALFVAATLLSLFRRTAAAPTAAL